jgi:hypothetical protein
VDGKIVLVEAVEGGDTVIEEVAHPHDVHALLWRAFEGGGPTTSMDTLALLPGEI